jgi:hypothetical protein
VALAKALSAEDNSSVFVDPSKSRYFAKSNGFFYVECQRISGWRGNGLLLNPA